MAPKKSRYILTCCDASLPRCKEDDAMVGPNLQAWIGCYNHDLGLPAAYDESILQLQSVPTGYVWFDHVRREALGVTVQQEILPPQEWATWGSIFLLYAEHPVNDFVLAFWEPETANGRAIPPPLPE